MKSTFDSPATVTPGFSVEDNGKEYQFSFRDQQFQVENFSLDKGLLIEKDNNQDQLNAVQREAVAIFKKSL